MLYRGEKIMIDKELLNILACPLCKADIKLENNRLICLNPECVCQYPIKDDIPVMLIGDAQRPCPKCGTQRDWLEETDTLRCPKCGTIFQHKV